MPTVMLLRAYVMLGIHTEQSETYIKIHWKKFLTVKKCKNLDKPYTIKVLSFAEKMHVVNYGILTE